MSGGVDGEKKTILEMKFFEYDLIQQPEKKNPEHWHIRLSLFTNIFYIFLC